MRHGEIPFSELAFLSNKRDTWDNFPGTNELKLIFPTVNIDSLHEIKILASLEVGFRR